MAGQPSAQQDSKRIEHETHVLRPVDEESIQSLRWVETYESGDTRTIEHVHHDKQENMWLREYATELDPEVSLISAFDDDAIVSKNICDEGPLRFPQEQRHRRRVRQEEISHERDYDDNDTHLRRRSA